MVINQTYGETLQKTLHFLKDSDYSLEDLRFLLMRYKRWNLTNYLQHQHQIITADDLKWFESIIIDLQKNYPLQYILGYEIFFDREFLVNEHTLIPRPETEWIVEYILKHENNQYKKVADIGTGSGVIGITLQLERPSYEVVLTDIDKNTLEVARTNANKYKASVKLKLGDNLNALDTERYDLIVSNPPYIDYEDTNLMDDSVLKYEPKKALFAKNHGYEFYEQLSELLPKYLSPNGRVYLEIGFNQGEKVKRILKKVFPNREIIIEKDYNNNERLIVMK